MTWLPIIISALSLMVAVASFVFNWLYTHNKFKQTQYPDLQVTLRIDHVCPGVPYLTIKWHNFTATRALNPMTRVVLGSADGTVTADWLERLPDSIAGGASYVASTDPPEFIKHLSDVIGLSVELGPVPSGSETKRGLLYLDVKSRPKFYVLAKVSWSPPLWNTNKTLERVICGLAHSEFSDDRCLRFSIEPCSVEDLPKRMTEKLMQLGYFH